MAHHPRHPIVFDLHGPVWMGPLLTLAMADCFGQHDEHVFAFRLWRLLQDA